MAFGTHPEDIKAAVRKKGVTLTSLALKNGLDPSACRAALKRPYGRAEKAISSLLGVPLHRLWPDRYDATGQRKTRHEREPNTTFAKPRSRQKAGAA